ncbi:hypothetical protein R1flu_016579 [Riccia fluitans]|uniref:Uncharacterized protein n=1 Tax=Riccia fluitans TaxID=41844 RepID=A0ABD1YM91_9MARC
MEIRKDKQSMDDFESKVETNLEWIVDFRKNLRETEIPQHGSRTYAYSVPHELKVLKESAFRPKAGLCLGLKSRFSLTPEVRKMDTLKARWARIYFKWRTKGVSGGEGSSSGNHTSVGAPPEVPVERARGIAGQAKWNAHA